MIHKTQLTPALLDSDPDFVLIKELSFVSIKPFIHQLISIKGRLLSFYMVYQSLALLLLLLLTGSTIYSYFLATAKPTEALRFLMLGFLFSFTALIILHELLHAAAYLLMGKRQLRFGANLRKFLFYVLAHHQVVNRKEFMIIALTPFVMLHMICIPFILHFGLTPEGLFFCTVLLCHALFCAGDFAMLSFFFQQKTPEVYTYDDAHLKIARFYVLNQRPDKT